MLNIKRREKPKQQAQVAEEKPYKRTQSSLPVAEDIEKCSRNFGNTYEMILAAAVRSKEILNGGTSAIKGHQPTVTAMLEIEAGTFDKDKYLSQVGTRRKQKV